MGVSMSWKPTDPTIGRSFASGSTLHGILENTFGGFPIVFSHKDIGKLQGISACGYAEVNDLIEAIVEYESVDVEAHW